MSISTKPSSAPAPASASVSVSAPAKSSTPSLAVVDPFDDARVTHRYSNVDGNVYHGDFLYAEPESQHWRATVFLIHGWPDLSMGWRHQIPLLLSLGLRVVCPDMMGYGRTTPKPSENPLSLYSLKQASNDIKELAYQLGAPRIILGGHDWGGAVIYRCAQWHPEFVTHAFSVCTPFFAPTQTYVSLEDHIARGKASQLQYQLHLAGPEVAAAVVSQQDIRQFLNGMYGARGPAREVMMDPHRGVLLENLPKMSKTKLLNDREMDYYVEEYSRHGVDSTLNWYRYVNIRLHILWQQTLLLFQTGVVMTKRCTRFPMSVVTSSYCFSSECKIHPKLTENSTRKINFDDELNLPARGINIPVLYICATQDDVLLPSMSAGMERHIPHLTRRDVAAKHWALWQAKDDVNKHLEQWFKNVVLGNCSKL